MSVFIGALREAVTRRVVLAGGILIFVYLVIYAAGMYFAATETADRMSRIGATMVLTLMGLYGVQFLSSVMAIMLASGSIAGEFDSDRALSVLARPISRWSWLTQRVAAFGGMAVAYVLIASAGIFGVSRAFTGYEPISMLRSGGLLMLQIAILVAVCVALSTRFSSVASAVIVVALYGLGWLSGIMEFVGRMIENDTVERIGVALSLFMPSDVLWRGASYYALSPTLVALGESGAGDIPFASGTPPNPMMIGWAVLYLIVVSVLAVQLVQRKDL